MTVCFGAAGAAAAGACDASRQVSDGIQFLHMFSALLQRFCDGQCPARTCACTVVLTAGGLLGLGNCSSSGIAHPLLPGPRICAPSSPTLALRRASKHHLGRDTLAGTSATTEQTVRRPGLRARGVSRPGTAGHQNAVSTGSRATSAMVRLCKTPSCPACPAGSRTARSSAVKYPLTPATWLRLRNLSTTCCMTVTRAMLDEIMPASRRSCTGQF